MISQLLWEISHLISYLLSQLQQNDRFHMICVFDLKNAHFSSYSLLLIKIGFPRVKNGQEYVRFSSFSQKSWEKDGKMIEKTTTA